MIGWHHWCCSPWGCKESNMTEQLKWTELWLFGFLCLPQSSAVTQLYAAGLTWGVKYILPRRTFNQEPVGVSGCACMQAQPFGLFAAPCTVASQDTLFMWFFRQKCWSRLPCPPPGHLPDPGIKPVSPALAGRLSPSHQGSSYDTLHQCFSKCGPWTTYIRITWSA